MDNTAYLGNAKLKRTGVSHEWTLEQIQEFIKCQEDPVYFIETYVKIINVDKGLINFKMHPYQINMVKNFVNERFVICKIPRQMGKTTTAAAVILWYTLFHDNYIVAVLAHKMQQSREILGRYQTAYENLPRWMQQGIDGWNKGDVVLENGSRVIASATSSSAIRGMSFNMVYLDEFAHVPTHLQNDFYASTYPTISSGTTTKVIITSTPKGLNLFYKIYKEAEEQKNSYVAIDVHWSAMPGRDGEWKKKTLADIGERRFNEEFNTEFLGSSLTLITASKLIALAGSTPIRSNEELAIWKDPELGHIYACVVDVARGVMGDSSVFTVVDITHVPYVVVARYKSNTVAPVVFPTYIFQVATKYNQAMILVEINDIGGQIADILHYELEYENLFMTQSKSQKGQVISGGSGRPSLGVRTTKPVKRIGCLNLKSLIEEDKLILNDNDIIEELYTFTEQGDTYKADEGAHDDLVMTLVLFAWLVNQDYFKELTNINIRERLLQEKQKAIEENLTPFGMFYDAADDDIESKMITVPVSIFEKWLKNEVDEVDERYGIDIRSYKNQHLGFYK